jgi:hypothetical protein
LKSIFSRQNSLFQNTKEKFGGKKFTLQRNQKWLKIAQRSSIFNIKKSSSTVEPPSTHKNSQKNHKKKLTINNF